MAISNAIKKFSLATVGAAVVAMGIGGAAQAASFTEVEGNNTFGTAQQLGPQDGTISVAGSRVGDSSADFFRFLRNGWRCHQLGCQYTRRG